MLSDRIEGSIQKTNRPGLGLQKAQHCLDQGRLARTIRTDDGKAFTAFYFKVGIMDDGFRPVAGRQTIDTNGGILGETHRLICHEEKIGEGVHYDFSVVSKP